MLGGGQALYTATLNRNPIEMTCADYLTKRPEGKWVKLKDCVLYRVQGADRRFFEKPMGEVFIPVRPVGASHESVIKILLASKRQEEIEFHQAADAAGDDPRKQADFVAKHLGQFMEKREIEGTIRHGLDDPYDIKREFEKTGGNLTPDCIVIDEGKHPSFLNATGLIVAALVFGILRLILESRRPASLPPLTSIQPPPLPAQPPPLPRRDD